VYLTSIESEFRRRMNEGIGGGRPLHDSPGPNALARFDRDVLSQTAVTHFIVQLGVTMSLPWMPPRKSLSSRSSRSVGNSLSALGGYQDANLRDHGFLFSRGSYTPIDPPSSISTRVYKINPQGDIVGDYVVDDVTPPQGFLLTRRR